MRSLNKFELKFFITCYIGEGVGQRHGPKNCTLCVFLQKAVTYVCVSSVYLDPCFGESIWQISFCVCQRLLWHCCHDNDISLEDLLSSLTCLVIRCFMQCNVHVVSGCSLSKLLQVLDGTRSYLVSNLMC